MRTLFIIFALFSAPLFADWQFSPILAYRSSGLYRGALYWPEPSVMPGIGVSYNNMIFLRGPMIEALKEWGNLSVRIGTELFDDNGPMMSLHDRSLDYRNERQETYGVYTAVKYGPNRRAFVEFALHQDLDEHKGIYIRESVNIPLIPFFSAAVDFAQGTRAANHYAYGGGAVGGVAHLDYSFKCRLPFLPWGGAFLASWKKAEIIKGANQNGHFIQGDRTNEQFMAMMMWQF